MKRYRHIKIEAVTRISLIVIGAIGIIASACCLAYAMAALTTLLVNSVLSAAV